MEVQRGVGAVRQDSDAASALSDLGYAINTVRQSLKLPKDFVRLPGSYLQIDEQQV
jgi:hypothetical protein